MWVEGSLSPPSFSLDSLDKLDSACINTVNSCNLHHALRFVMGPDQIYIFILHSSSSGFLKVKLIFNFNSHPA